MWTPGRIAAALVAANGDPNKGIKEYIINYLENKNYFQLQNVEMFTGNSRKLNYGFMFWKMLCSKVTRVCVTCFVFLGLQCVKSASAPLRLWGPAAAPGCWWRARPVSRWTSP